MSEPVKPPGTRSDPEFYAVRVPPWDAPFSCRVRFPRGLPGLNRFLTEDWWSRRASELDSLGARVHHGGQATLVTTEGEVADADLPETTIVVVQSFPRLLDLAWESSGEPDFTEWVSSEVLSASAEEPAQAGAAAWRYDLTLARIGESDQARELFVWPSDPDTLTLTELLAAPHLPDLPERPDLTTLPASVVPLVEELWRLVDASEATYRLSLVHRAHDATAMLRRGTDPRVAQRVGAATGSDLRQVAKQTRAAATRAGWRLTGYADALLWPITVQDASYVPVDFVCDLAIDLLRRAETAPLPPAPDLDEWDRRLAELESIRSGTGAR